MKGLNSEMKQAGRIIRRGFGTTGVLPIYAPAGTLRLRELLMQALPVTLLFMWVLVLMTSHYRFDHKYLLEGSALLGVIIGMLFPTFGFVLYVAGTYHVIRYSVARARAVVFWLYWPCTQWFSCVAAICLAFYVGDYLWFNHFRLYHEYDRLQAYDNVDTYSVTGSRLQDAGLVVFNSTNSVDRAMGSCLQAEHTYCIAPVVQGGVLHRFEQQNRVGVMDIFMVGTDCCNCPMTDFRCGDWRDPRAPIGGMRLLDDEQRRYYRIALDRFDIDFNKISGHGIFFHWVNDPVQKWKDLWTRGFQLMCLALIFGIFAPFLWAVILNGFMKFLKHSQLAAPLEAYEFEAPAYDNYGTTGKPVEALEEKGFFPETYRAYLHQSEPTGTDTREEPKFVIL